jgi:hypothetical protein
MMALKKNEFILEVIHVQKNSPYHQQYNHLKNLNQKV